MSRTLLDVLNDLAAQQLALDAARSREHGARSEATDVLNEINHLQKEFDQLVLNARSDLAAAGSDWGRG